MGERYLIGVFLSTTEWSASAGHPWPAEFRGMDTSRIEGLRDFTKDLDPREEPDLEVAITQLGFRLPAKLRARHRSSM
jgi:S-sulfosulfanyl-L-cysteine sulfohydrolase